MWHCCLVKVKLEGSRDILLKSLSEDRRRMLVELYVVCVSMTDGVGGWGGEGVAGYDTRCSTGTRGKGPEV